MDDLDKSTDDSLRPTGEAVQDGEIVASDIEPSSDNTGSDALILESLESMIRENLAKIDSLNLEIKQQKDMIDSVLLNDETYQNHENAAKEAAKLKNVTKAEILKRADVAHIAAKLKEMQTEVKEMKESMNSYLSEYQRLSGSNEIEDARGETFQLVYQIKLVRRRA